jgi:hypothetical protein
MMETSFFNSTKINFACQKQNEVYQLIFPINKLFKKNPARGGTQLYTLCGCSTSFRKTTTPSNTSTNTG